jgi:hypothetical protein
MLLIVIALIVGLLGSVLYLERDPQVQAVLSRFIAQGLGAVGNCRAQCVLSRISLLEGIVEFDELSARSHLAGDFEWGLFKGAVSFSWRALVTRWSLALAIHAERCSAKTRVTDTRVPLVDHFKRFFETPPIPPCIVEQLSLPHAELEVVHQERNAQFRAVLALDCTVAPQFGALCSIHTGSLRYGSYDLFSHIALQVRAQKTESAMTWSLQGSCRGLLTGNSEAPLVGEGDRVGRVRLGDDTTPVLYELDIQPDGFIKGTAQRGGIMVDYTYSPVEGQKISASLWGWALTLWSACHDVGTLSCVNGQRRAEAEWGFDKNRATVSGIYTDGRDRHSFDVSADLDDRALQGALDGTEYTLAGGQAENGSWFIQAQRREKPLIAAFVHADGNIEAILELASVADFVPALPLHGEGQIRAEGKVSGDEIIGTLTFDRGKILIPKTALVIDHATIPLIYNFAAQTLTAHTAEVRIARGSLGIQRAVVRHDDQGILSAHASATITHGLFMPISAALAVFSGSGTLSWHRAAGGKIAGEVLIDRAVYDGGLFPAFIMQSSDKSLFGDESWELMLHCATRAPITCKTPVCTLEGHADFLITGPIAAPHIRGALYDLQGVVHFPYKPLYLNGGKITLPGAYPPIPELALTAHGVVRQYDITLHLEGTAFEPHLRFESSPSLRDEQIMSLLLSGLEDGIVSLNLSHDSFSILHGLLASAHAPEQRSSWWSSLLAPLRRVRLIPKLHDQSGRGGVRGAVEIEVDDRLRATIQHNFSLSEDIKIGVDYAVSDDMHIRALRDERGDYAAELEMRWKL